MSGGAYPCNIDCGKRQQLEKRITLLEAEVKLWKDSHVFAVAAAYRKRCELEERIRLALTWLPNNPGTAMGCLQEKPE